MINIINQKYIMEESHNISNREALKDKIHEIHNFLRNNGAGYGMNALKVFNVIYGLKKIEDNNLIDKVNLKRPECEFSYLLKLANENKDEELVDLIIGDLLTHIANSDIRSLLFYEIPRNIKGKIFNFLIKEINNISIIEKSCNVLLSGKIYEYFIGRDLSAISELGAYFTDRHITDYIYNKIKPTINDDNTINTMIDMFGGSGGFTTGYIDYLIKNHEDINWENEINKIYHYDMNEDVIKSAGLEFFCLTGVIPNLKNLEYKNSFTDNFIDSSTNENKKYHYVITNPPYGGDKNKKSSTNEKNIKIKEYIKNELKTLEDEETIKKRNKQLKNIELKEKKEKEENEKNKVCLSSCSLRINKFSKKYKLKGNDKESCSLMLMMDLLDINGTCCGVLKEGVFFDKKYKDLRKTLIENYNIKEVISVPQDQFENTSTKTSIIIFENTEEKTKEIKFSKLIVEKFEEDKFVEINNKIYLIENKGDIKDVYDEIVSEATREELLENKINSLNGKDYNKKEIKYNKEEYNLVKLGDIIEFLQKSKRNASFGKNEGLYNFYTSSDKIQKCDISDYEEECIIIGTGGIANIKIDKKFSCSVDNLIIKSKYNKYIYNYINSNIQLLKDGFKGTTLKHISKDYILNILIPLPKTEEKLNYWIEKISLPYNLKIEKELKLKELELEVKNKIKEIKEYDEINLEELAYINFDNLKNNSLEYINYIDISSIKDEKINEIKLYKNNYPSRAKRIIKKGDILYSTVRPNLKGYTLINTDIINGIASTGFVVIRSKKINSKYLYEIIKEDSINNYLIKNISGTTYPSVSPEIFKNIKIKIPKNIELINNLEPIFNEIEKIKNEILEKDKLYNEYLTELLNNSLLN